MNNLNRLLEKLSSGILNKPATANAAPENFACCCKPRDSGSSEPASCRIVILNSAGETTNGPPCGWAERLNGSYYQDPLITCVMKRARCVDDPCDEISGAPTKPIQTTPTTPSSRPPSSTSPPPTHREKFITCPDELAENWPPRVTESGDNAAKQCAKIKVHFAQLAKHIMECAKKCGSDNGLNYDWDTCLRNKWNDWLTRQPITSVPIEDTGNAIAAVPFEMGPVDDPSFPIRPGLSETELKNCKMRRNRCACAVKKKKLEHLLKLAELAENYYWMCPPYNKDDAKTKFKNACDALKLEKPASDKCAPNADYGDNCKRYCKNCV